MHGCTSLYRCESGEKHEPSCSVRAEPATHPPAGLLTQLCTVSPRSVSAAPTQIRWSEVLLKVLRISKKHSWRNSLSSPPVHFASCDRPRRSWSEMTTPFQSALISAHNYSITLCFIFFIHPLSHPLDSGAGVCWSLSRHQAENTPWTSITGHTLSHT